MPHLHIKREGRLELYCVDLVKPVVPPRSTEVLTATTNVLTTTNVGFGLSVEWRYEQLG